MTWRARCWTDTPRPRRAAAAAALAALALCAAPAQADIQSEMERMFDRLGSYGNVTAPQMIRGQTRNVATFGGLYHRAPRRTYSVAGFSPPSWRAGCAGIDLYAGSFSFINKDQFIQYLRNVASNSVGLAFKMALSSLSPELSKTLEDLQKSTEALNRFNLDSCEAAQALVKGDVGVAMLGGETACRNLGTFLNTFSDGAEARLMCGSEAEARPVADAAAAEPALEAVAPLELSRGNMMWKVLGKVSGIDDDMREALMSATGTFVLAPASPTVTVGAGPRHVPPTLSSAKDLLSDRVRLLDCVDTGCVTVTVATVTLSASFRGRVAARIGSIAAKMRDGTGTLTAEEQGFLTSNSLPVLQLLQADAAGAAGLAEMATDAVALGVAHTFLSEALRIARDAAAGYQTRSATEAALLARLAGNGERMRRDIFLEFNAEVARLGEVLDIRRDIAGIRASLWRGRFRENLVRIREEGLRRAD